MDVASHIFYSFIMDKVLNVVFNAIRKIHKKKAVQVFLAIVFYFIMINVAFRLLSTGEEKNIYEEFGVSINASAKVIRQRFRHLSKIYHPDRKTGDKRLYMRLVNLQDTLLDPRAKFIYDRFGIVSGKQSNETVMHIFQGIVKTYSCILMIVPFLLFNIFNRFKFKVVVGLMLVLLALFTYMIFLKRTRDILDIMFPGLMTFQIVKMLTSQVLYQIVYITRLITFASEKKLRMHKKMIEEVTQFYKNHKESFAQSDSKGQ